ncbi:MAG: hypothetical protein LAO21_13240 [Acidobacteriia bacterium]|nr:hypothetical protein [Terriglobia bacterium]
MDTRSLNRTGLFSTRIFVAAVFAICVGLGSSALYGFLTLVRLRDQYLEKIGHDIAASVDAQTRGPGRRNNLSVWESALEEAALANPEKVTSLALLDHTGRTLVSFENKPDRQSAPTSGQEKDVKSSIYWFEDSFSASPRSAQGRGAEVTGWRIRMGLQKSQAAFITRQAYSHLITSALAIVALLTLSFYFLRTLDQFLKLRTRENLDKHLATLGQMAATLAHEIRNPLGAMKGLAQVTQESLPPDHEAQALMITVVNEAKRLEQLVNDLLSFARPGKPELSQFDLKRLSAEVIAMLEAKPGLNGGGIRLSCPDETLFVHSDPNGIRQVLLNIFLNAIQVTPAGQAISVALRKDETTREAVIEVDDCGPGLGDQSPEDLFEPFTTGRIKGTGLGLAVSKQIIERLGGSITLANRAEGGARCSLRVPIGF